MGDLRCRFVTCASGSQHAKTLRPLRLCARSSANRFHVKEALQSLNTEIEENGMRGERTSRQKPLWPCALRNFLTCP